LIISLQATIISSVIISAQTADQALVAMFSYSCGLEFYPDFGYESVSSLEDSNLLFADMVIISLGFVLVFACTLPMAYFNLDDNILIQIGVCLSMLVIVFGVWMVDFFLVGLDFERVSMIGPKQGKLLGTVIFNYAYVTSIPSWVNEKKEGVSINRSIWGSSLVATALFIVVGLIGGWAFPFPPHNDILNVLIGNDNSVGWAMKMIARISVYLFPIVVLLSSIPVYSIVIRYNLIESGLCGKNWANLWAVLFPWVVSVPFYTGSGLSNIISWVGLFVNGFINFVIPLLFYIIALKRYGGKEPVGYEQITAPFQKQNHEEEQGLLALGDCGISGSGISELEINTQTCDNPTSFVAMEKDLKFRSVPKFLERLVPPIWIATTLSTIITLGIVATIVLNLVELGRGNDVFS